MDGGRNPLGASEGVHGRRTQPGRPAQAARGTQDPERTGKRGCPWTAGEARADGGHRAWTGVFGRARRGKRKATEAREEREAKIYLIFETRGYTSAAFQMRGQSG